MCSFIQILTVQYKVPPQMAEKKNLQDASRVGVALYSFCVSFLNKCQQQSIVFIYLTSILMPILNHSL